MSLFYRYISAIFLRYFFFLFISLECFFVAIDSLQHLDRLPSSANLIILLLGYEFIYAMQFILPLALILTQIVTMMSMLKSSQWTIFLALGYSRFRVFLPTFLLGLFITLIFITLNATPLAYAKERIDAIVSQGAVGSFKSDLFVKNNNNYVYISKIYPLLQQAENIVIYELREESLTRIIEAKIAQFVDDEWILKDATITALDEAALKVDQTPQFATLKGFKPKILENIYEDKGTISITDAIEAIMLLDSQNANTQKARGALYRLVFFPLFAPLLMVLISVFLPVSNRYANIAMLSLVLILGVLVIWGIFFGFSELSLSGFLQPEFSILAPILALFLASSFSLYKTIKE